MARPGGCSVFSLALAALAFGAANSVATRALLLQPCPDACGGAPSFAKPVFSVVLAFAAMALSLPAAALLRCCGVARASGGGGGDGGGAACADTDLERVSSAAPTSRLRSR